MNPSIQVRNQLSIAVKRGFFEPVPIWGLISNVCEAILLSDRKGSKRNENEHEDP